MSFPAQYRGTCAECGYEIEPGQLIRGENGEYEHVVCPDAVADELAEKPCDRCHLVHQGECL